MSVDFPNGWWLTYPSEKYDFVSWNDDIPNIWKHKKCSKPPSLPILDTLQKINSLLVNVDIPNDTKRLKD